MKLSRASPEPQTGKRYWRQPGRAECIPEFRGLLERDFPSGAAHFRATNGPARLFEIDGRIDGAGRLRADELRRLSASGSIHEEL